MEKINVTVQNQTGADVVLRLGDAAPIQYAKPINIDGILAAPSQFLAGKKLDAETCHLRIEKASGVIALHILDTDPNSKSVIKGELKFDTYFTAWGINTPKRWSVSDFMKHVKMMRIFFVEKTEADAIVTSLQKWQAKVEIEMKEFRDNAGNSLSLLERKVGEIPLKNTFRLAIPIYQGYPKQTFNVEVGFEPSSSDVKLYLLSTELFELEIEHRDQLINLELAKFSDFACSKVVIS